LERRSRGKLIAIAGTIGALLGVYLLEKAQAKPIPTSTTITSTGVTLPGGVISIQPITPPTKPPTVAPPVITPVGTLECHAYADSAEVRAKVTISGISDTFVTPFTKDLPPGTYVLTASYLGQTRSTKVSIEAGKTVRIDFKFVAPTAPAPTPAPPPSVIGKTPADIPSDVWAYLENQLAYEINQLNANYNQKYIQVNYAFSGSFDGHPDSVEIGVSGYGDWIILGVSLPKWTYIWGRFIFLEYFYAPSWQQGAPPSLDYMKKRVVDEIINNLKQNIYIYFNGQVTVYNTKTFQVLTVSL
jgi:hypothetical protein